MAQPKRAAHESYRRTFGITKHAIERLRERLTQAGRIEHRPDWDLANLLDCAIGQAIGQGREDRVEGESGTESRVDLTDAIGFPLVAVLKKGDIGPNRRVCVTVLDREMVERDRARRSRENGARTRLGDVFGDRLRRVTPTPSPRMAKKPRTETQAHLGGGYHRGNPPPGTPHTVP